ncbi:lambda repressor-like predicted transcriptional regulator [Saccharothrix coeruleofusca]|uniref:hypothetical protein n=1 Tax=Saccharothrix coeruleofusca TaxID=33919 RepID=UPI001AE46BD3|nr:hypothetical protein [Saccharothrix coeruleofusca]MBP2341043.1 lambda repressor-like predicted transcriptional regulator [Saccharothrix coeruleofusca]
MTDGERDPGTEKTFSQHVTAALQKRRWSARRAATESGLSVQTVINMTAGFKAQAPDEPWRPTEESVTKLARGLKERPEVWLRRAGYYVDEPSGDSSTLAEEIALLEDDERRALRLLVRSLLTGRGYIEPGESRASQPALPDLSHGEAGIEGVRSGPVEIGEVPAPDRSDEVSG